jgi:hypothetical protein
LLLCPEVGGGENGNDFEVDEILPASDPGVQRFRIWRFHDLEAARAVGIHPARVVGDALGQHAAAELESRADGPRIAILESFNDHEEHGLDFTPT